MRCMFTGHRDIPNEVLGELRNKIYDAVCDAYKEGVREFIAGGALGFDTLAAEAVLRLKAEYPDVELFLCLPCRNQTAGWSPANKARYAQILDRAAQITYITERYIRGCMQARNRKMVDNADVCIAYLNSDTGGTAYTVNYALQKGLKIINLAK